MGFALCVFCGSGLGARAAYAHAAQVLGDEIGRRGWTLVYGGGHVGLMGVVADAALASGARVVGIIPRFLYDREVAHRGLSALEIVASFAERKQRMGELADAFLSLPGGVGTLDELFEAWSWTLAGLQRKPSGLLNVDGYYDDVVRFIGRAEAEGFLRPGARTALTVASEIGMLLDALEKGTGERS